MKILVADKISPSGVAYLRSQPGFEVLEAYQSSGEEIVGLVGDVDAIVVRSETQINRMVIEAASRLRVVGRAGVGVDNIDVEAATERGIVVMNTPTGNSVATAELTFTHMLCGARPVPQAVAMMREGKWDRKGFSGMELYRKTLGIVGLGRIGSEVARRAQAFGMRVVAHDPFLAPSRAKAMQIECLAFDALLAVSDYITVHMPLTEGTRHLIDAAAFEKMKDGVRIFNCARGGIIDEAALLAAVNSGKVAAAGLDVFEDEPPGADSELRGHPRILLTPHLGASTIEAQESVGIEIAEAITEALSGGVIRSAVNMPSIDAETLEVLKPYLELGANLGTLLQQISPAQVEKIQVSYWGKIVDLDSNSVTRGILKGYLRLISGGDVNFVNAPVIMKRLGIEVDVTKTNLESDYTELVQVEAFGLDGTVCSVAGTLIGKANIPRVININGQAVETDLGGIHLILENKDEPGIVGQVGTEIGRDGVNIATISMSRNEVGGVAMTVVNLDSELSDAAMEAITAAPGVKRALLVHA
ncbi:MAG: phosphoglycerate dehydrogenase [Verrucomicrobia bacterium]|nr:MAG: phosphoglycerate dehydrogenase [Verrucomicrobiota bacterium]